MKQDTTDSLEGVVVGMGLELSGGRCCGKIWIRKEHGEFGELLSGWIAQRFNLYPLL